MSNNGWSNDPPSLVELGVPGVADTGSVRAGVVAQLFDLFLDDFHRTVEPLRTINGFRSYALNKASGGIETSNHRSGTALDLNGYRHPYEPSAPKPYNDGFTDAQTAQIRRLLAKYEVIKWGMDFNRGYRDAMHFEIRGTAAQVAAVVARLTPRPTPPPPAPTPPAPAPPEIPEVEIMPYPRYYRIEGTNLAYEDLGDRRRRTSLPQYQYTSSQYPKGIGIAPLPVTDGFWNLPIVEEDSYGEGYQQPGKPHVWVDASEDGFHGRRYVSAETYAKRHGFSLMVLPDAHAFWKLPVIGTPPPA